MYNCGATAGGKTTELFFSPHWPNAHKDSPDADGEEPGDEEQLEEVDDVEGEHVDQRPSGIGHNYPLEPKVQK